MLNPQIKYFSEGGGNTAEIDFISYFQGFQCTLFKKKKFNKVYYF